jgi:dTDP-4-dehydrorhamnose reductase
MSIDKIILFGSTGMLGRYICQYFNDKINISTIDYRISEQNFERLEEQLTKVGIDNRTCVINSIGLIPQRKNKNVSDKEYYIINGLFPNILWELCKKYKAKMIQPSTDCVFSGIQGEYIETDIHDETNAYGISKSLGEPCGSTIIRTSIIGLELHNKKSFLEWVISNNNKKIKGFTDHYWNGITCLEYCKIIHEIIMKDLFWTGVRHICSPEIHTKYEIAEMIANVFDLNIEIEEAHTEIINKSLKSVYKNEFNIPELQDQIKELKYFNIL